MSARRIVVVTVFDVEGTDTVAEQLQGPYNLLSTAAELEKAGEPGCPGFVHILYDEQAQLLLESNALKDTPPVGELPANKLTPSSALLEALPD